MLARSGTARLTPVVLAMTIALPAAAQSAVPAAVFRPVIAELRGKVKIPVLLPATLPAVLRSPEITDVRVMTATADSYSVDLHYNGVGGDAGFAAFFQGARAGADHVDARHQVRLANGALAVFDRVHCGGSCGPANLSWRQDGVVYRIQIALPSDTPVRAQADILVATANSMVPFRTASALRRRR